MANDEKPTKKKGADALYENDRSPGREKVTESKKVTEREPAEEPRNAKGQTQGEERDEGEEGAAKGGESEDAGGGKAGDKTKEQEDPVSMFREITKRHEGERRDTHNAHREAMRLMQKRHEKELEAHFGRMGDNGEPEPGPADGAAAAPAAAAPAPVPAAGG